MPPTVTLSSAVLKATTSYRATFTEGTISVADAILNLASGVQQFTHGTGANQANMVWSQQRSVTAGAPDDLDLAGGLSINGVTITFTAVKHLRIKNLDTDQTKILEVGGGANPFASWLGAGTDKLKIPGAGGELFLSAPGAAGYAVTAGTGDILRLAASSGTISYQIALIGIV